MDFAQFLNNKYVFGTLAGIGGIVLTLLYQAILNRRVLFTYTVHHDRIAVSADDAIFGTVRVTWNDSPVGHLFHSTLEMTNASMRDFEDIVVRVYTSDTDLLTERTEVCDTTHILYWTDEYSKQLAVPAGDTPTAQQYKSYWSRRDYKVPTLNRGQSIRIQYLNAAKTDKRPNIWLEVVHPGVKVQYRAPQNEVYGIPVPQAAWAGALIGFGLVGAIIVFVQSIPVAALLALVYGFVAQIPGAWALRGWRALRRLLSG